MAQYIYIWSKGVQFTVVVRKPADFSWFWSFTQTFGGKHFERQRPTLVKDGMEVSVCFKEGDEESAARYARQLRRSRIQFRLDTIRGREEVFRSSNTRWYKIDLDIIEDDMPRVTYEDVLEAKADVQLRTS